MSVWLYSSIHLSAVILLFMEWRPASMNGMKTKYTRNPRRWVFERYVALIILSSAVVTSASAHLSNF